MATALRYPAFAEMDEGNDLAAVRPDLTFSPPARFVVRELSMKLEDGLQFFYKNPGLAQPLPAGGIAAVIADLIAPSPPSAASLDVAQEPARPETPLDLNIFGAPIYVVLRLDPTIRWSFSATSAAISLKDAQIQGHYGELRHILPDGTAQAEPGTGCRLIYFAANPPPIGENESYRHGLNFHIDLVQNSPHGTGTQILPIIIDPDVGHPGGSDT